MIADGRAQLWCGDGAVVVTELVQEPQQKICHVFLAAGRMAEIERLADEIEGWAVREGCTKARLTGRKGWARTFLSRTGWRDTELVTLERELNGH